MKTFPHVLLCWGLLTAAQTALAADNTFSASLRALRTTRSAADQGPVAQANAVQLGTATISPSTNTVLAELQGDLHGDGWTLHAGAAIAWRQADGATRNDPEGRITEAYASGAALGWQWSAGKKVVAWDVGYGFRPNDVVQQEARRSLAFEPLEGRPLLMAERFSAESAWSLVWVNPTQALDAHATQEAALAARWYTRRGAADWHAFVRQGERSGASVGAAVSWVADDALELHASVRAYEHTRTLTSSATGSALAPTNPWQRVQSGAGSQLLVGGTWTWPNEVSLTVEAWHDATALSDAQWDAWMQRNRALPLWLARGVPASAVAGNLAWQADAFGASSNLRQDNLFVRLSWQHARWASALDLLYTPADQGLLATASVVWTGEQVKIEAGLRSSAGSESALVRQLPVQRQGYVVATWAF